MPPDEAPSLPPLRLLVLLVLMLLLLGSVMLGEAAAWLTIRALDLDTSAIWALGSTCAAALLPTMTLRPEHPPCEADAAMQRRNWAWG